MLVKVILRSQLLVGNISMCSKMIELIRAGPALASSTERNKLLTAYGVLWLFLLVSHLKLTWNSNHKEKYFSLNVHYIAFLTMPLKLLDGLDW